MNRTVNKHLPLSPHSESFFASFFSKKEGKIVINSNLFKQYALYLSADSVVYGEVKLLDLIGFGFGNTDSDVAQLL